MESAGTLCVSGFRGIVGTSGNRVRSLLLLSEIAVTVVLVVIGGALTGSFVRLSANRSWFSIRTMCWLRLLSPPATATSITLRRRRYSSAAS